MKKNYLLIFIAIATGIVLFSCSYSAIVIPEVEVPDVISFSEQIEPIFSDQGCTSCHPGFHAPDLTTGNAYASITTGDKYINLDNPEASLIYTKPHPEGSHSKKYTYEQAALILAWITNGAEEN